MMLQANNIQQTYSRTRCQVARIASGQNMSVKTVAAVTVMKEQQRSSRASLNVRGQVVKWSSKKRWTSGDFSVEVVVLSGQSNNTSLKQQHNNNIEDCLALTATLLRVAWWSLESARGLQGQRPMMGDLRVARKT